MKKILQILGVAVALAVNAGAQTDPVAKSRLDKQGQILTQLAKRLVAAETAIKSGTGSVVTIADVQREIKNRAVELPHVRPSGIWNRREIEETKFRSDLRTELDGVNDDLGEIEQAVAHPKRGERKAAIRAIRAARGW